MNEQATESKPKKPFYKKWWVWVSAIIVLIIVAGCSKSSSTKQSVPAANDKAEGTQASQPIVPTPAPVAMQSLLKLSGSGTKSTQKFTAGGDWDLNWNYDCSNFGYQGNFIISIFNGDGSMSFENSGVNQLGKSGSDIDHFHKGGTYYLQINSECKWSIEVKG